jgi:hypothetical protein
MLERSVPSGPTGKHLAPAVKQMAIRRSGLVVER